MSQLAQFLIAYSNDGTVRTNFDADPEAVLNDASWGLSDAAKDAIRSLDELQIRTVLTDELASDLQMGPVPVTFAFSRPVTKATTGAAAKKKTAGARKASSTAKKKSPGARKSAAAAKKKTAKPASKKRAASSAATKRASKGARGRKRR